MKNRADSLQSTPTYSIDFESILVVENNLNDHLLLHYLLRQHLQEVVPVGATSTQQALTYLDNCYAQQKSLPILILLDLYLPRRADGWKLLRKLRSNPLYRSIPIAVFSSSTNLQDAEQLYAWGVTSYIKKPVSLEGWQKILPVIPSMLNVGETAI
ncbi:response regulator [Larkinella insperata]|uniref:Response regulator n=1 Tax=Larkinella insperata TaxID=332158 RepID=A0ABW3QLS5_9BACT|nr:response regulator [Larkinella insperata]